MYACWGLGSLLSKSLVYQAKGNIILFQLKNHLSLMQKWIVLSLYVNSTGGQCGTFVLWMQTSIWLFWGIVTQKKLRTTV